MYLKVPKKGLRLKFAGVIHRDGQAIVELVEFVVAHVGVLIQGVRGPVGLGPVQGFDGVQVFHKALVLCFVLRRR